MNKELQELLERVEAQKVLTEKQKEIILRKAEALGEDMDEVVFRLESIPLKTDPADAPKESAKLGRVEKCPHCGAPVMDTMLACPECGFVFAEETGAGKKARRDIAELEQKLIEAAKPASKNEAFWDPEAAGRRIVNVIQAFPLPVTKEGLLLFLEFAYSNYSGASEDEIINAWHGKMTQAYLTLSRLGKDDPKIQQELMFYKPASNETEESGSGESNRSSCLYLLILLFLLALVLF